MRISILKMIKLALINAVIFLVFLNNGHACEKPIIKKNLVLEETAGSGFRTDWQAVKNARYYEIKYVLRAPEGRILLQREAVSEFPFFELSKVESSKGEFLQLIVDVTAHCDDAKSSPAFAQIALKNSNFGCRFDKQIPELKNENLSWVPIKQAQTYMMCFYLDKNQASCQETTNVHNKISLEKTRLISVAPVCNSVTGIPIFISVSSNLVTDKK